MLPDCDNSWARFSINRGKSGDAGRAALWRGYRPASAPTGAINLDLKVANLLAQRISVDAEEVGGSDLVAMRRSQRGRQQRRFHLAQDAMVEPRGRQAIVEAGKITRQVALDRAR